MEQDIDDAFAELGLTPDATELEFKAAWRRLVSQWHPDRNDSAAAHAKMQRINRAVEAIRQAGFRASEPAAGTAGAKPARSKGPRRRGGSERNDPPAGDAGLHDVELRAGAAREDRSESHARPDG